MNGSTKRKLVDIELDETDDNDDDDDDNKNNYTSVGKDSKRSESCSYFAQRRLNKRIALQGAGRRNTAALFANLLTQLSDSSQKRADCKQHMEKMMQDWITCNLRETLTLADFCKEPANNEDGDVQESSIDSSSSAVINKDGPAFEKLKASISNWKKSETADYSSYDSLVETIEKYASSTKTDTDKVAKLDAISKQLYGISNYKLQLSFQIGGFLDKIGFTSLKNSR